MKLQVLISTMHQTDHSLLERMNIRSDAIVINQCDRDSIERFSFRGHDILWMSLSERGVGLSRNNALMRAWGDILLFADDDVVYSDNYDKIVMKAFDDNPGKDMIVFNLHSQNSERPEPIVKQDYKLRWFNCMKFGACRIAIRRDRIRKVNVCFSLLFGGGAEYQCGEDTLFIVECLKKRIKGLASNAVIGIVKQEDSCWFKGYDEEYFYDIGVLMKQCFGYAAGILIVPLLIKNRFKTRELGLRNALLCAFRGANSI